MMTRPQLCACAQFSLPEGADVKNVQPLGPTPAVWSIGLFSPLLLQEGFPGTGPYDNLAQHNLPSET